MHGIRTSLLLTHVMLLGAIVPLASANDGLDECRALVRHQPTDIESYECYWRTARGRGSWDEAQTELNSILAVEPRNHAARLYLAAIRVDLGGADALQLLRESAEGFADSRQIEGEVHARVEIAWILMRRGLVEEALPELERARQLAETSGDSIFVAKVDVAEARLALARAEYGTALELLLEAKRIVVPDGPASLQSRTLSTLGYAYWALGLFDRGIEVYSTEAEILARIGDTFELASPRYNVALLAGRLLWSGQMERDEYLVLVRRALETAVEVGNPQLEIRCRLLLAQELEGEVAAEHYRLALAQSREVASRITYRQALWGLAQLLWYENPDRQEEALGLIDEPIEDARGAGAPTAEARGLILRALMTRPEQDRQDRITAYGAAFDAVERIRDLQAEGSVRSYVFSQWTFPYYRFAGGLLLGLSSSSTSADDLDLAFRAIERMRARVLLDELDRAGATTGVEDGGTTDIRRVQELLNPDEALLSFQLAMERPPGPRRTDEGGAWLTGITRERAIAYALPELEEIEDRVAVFTGLLLRRDGSEIAAASRLYDDLLGAALDDMDPSITRLVIVADRNLHRLPFEALRGRDGEPVATSFEISYVPSATVWTRWRHQVAEEDLPTRVLAFADPLLPGSAARDSLYRTPLRGVGITLGALPHARREAAALATTLASGSRVLSGLAASEAALKNADLSEFGILHFAAHAVVDGARPERSAVLLAPGGDGEDGLLQIREIVDLDLAGRVVLVTACRSASGTVLAGEGVVGLARAFFQAGARAVIGSPWPLKDDDAAALMRSFGKELAQGRSLTEAMAASRRMLIDRGAPAMAWAGLVVLGDGNHRPVPGAAPAAGPRALTVVGWSFVLVALLVWTSLRFRHPWT